MHLYLSLSGSIAGLLEIIRKHTYVGMADETHALLQHGTRLYLLDVAELSRDMFYQQVSPEHRPGFHNCPSLSTTPSNGGNQGAGLSYKLRIAQAQLLHVRQLNKERYSTSSVDGEAAHAKLTDSSCKSDSLCCRHCEDLST